MDSNYWCSYEDTARGKTAPWMISAVLKLLSTIQILVVDDGSPDRTVDICQGIAGQVYARWVGLGKYR